jgi:potassium efflux system protein
MIFAQRPVPLRPVALLALLALLACGALAQESGPPAFLKEAPLTTETVEKAAEKVKADASLDEAAKEAALKSYEAALAELGAAAAFQERINVLETQRSEAIAEAESIRAELERRRAGELPTEATEQAELPDEASDEEIASRLTLERSRVAELARLQRETESELAQLEARPSANRQRLIELSRLLAEAESGFSKWLSKSPSSPQERAELALDQAKIRHLRAEIALLEGEAPVFEPTRQRLQSKRDLMASDLGLVRERVSRLERRSGALVAARIGEAERLITELGLEAAGGTAPELQDLLKSARDLSRRNESLLSRLYTADAQYDASLDELEKLRRESENIRAQIEIGGLQGAFSEVMLELRRTLPTQQRLRASISERREAVITARLEAFRTEREIGALASPTGQAEEVLDRLRDKGVEEDALARLRPGLVELARFREKLGRDYVEGNRRLADRLGEIDHITHEKLLAASSLRDFLGERLIWVASSPPLGREAFTGLRSAFLRVAGPQALADYAAAFARIGAARWTLAASLALVLLLPRRRLRRLLAESGSRTRRISRDGIGNTLRAMGITLWLALPTPVLLAFFGWTLAGDPRATGSTYALGEGLLAPALLLLALRFSAILCWPGGVAEAHFRWRRAVLDPLHRAFMRLIFLYLPAHLLLAIWWNDSENLSAFQGPGRLVFIVAMLMVALVLATYLRHGRDGVIGESRLPRSWALKLRRYWAPATALLPVALAVLAASGHFLTAVALAYLTQKTVVVVGGAVLANALLMRWAELRQRRMALADALAQREARRAAKAEAEAAAAEESDAGEQIRGEESFIPLEEDEPLDWTTVGEQTRHLIRAVVILSALLGCWLAWSGAMPALNYLDKMVLYAEVSLGDLIWLIIVGAVTTIVFQNLPGLLELGFLRALEVESGVRNAIVTLCQYLVVAVGVVAATRLVGLDWSRLGWIAAALSVGLGFGLQEVVANFVSGLILLFERPIRVGDVVTVGGVDGVVTKIRIRATTITNWDKKEFIVPNKEFVTGTIMNWTLSNGVNRLVFPVGIAYGSDTEKARSVLLAIADEQPEVLKDPAPAAVFETFGDSSLNFSLRCFLGSTESRLAVTHRINSLIHERFAEAGIGIPFPQRDVHLIPAPGKEG